MARLEAQFKLLYYPTPQSEVDRICTLITPQRSSTTRILDPCAGEGQAIQSINDHLRARGSSASHAFSVELSPERAQAHSNRVAYKDYYNHTIVQADWKTMRVSNEGFGLAFVNPPYDWADDERPDGNKKQARQEYMFLRDVMPKIQIDGILVWVVPEKMLKYAHVRTLLALNLAQISVYRFAPAEYERFNQIVVMGKRRHAGPSDEQYDILKGLAENGVAELDAARTYQYMVPAQLKPTVLFQRSDMPDDSLLEWVAQSGGAHKLQPFREYIAPRKAEFTPLVSPRTGHAATLLASGMMGTINLGETLIKGSTAKAVIYYDEAKMPLPSGQADKAHKAVTTFSSEITELNLQDGAFRTYTDVADLQELFTRHAKPLTDAIFERYKPLYDGHINGQGPILDTLMPERKLPGMKHAGMLPLQKQLAVAAETSCRKYGIAIIVGEMGIGKSVCSLGTTEILDAYPAIVLTPTHLVQKWIRECKDAVPGSHPVELRTIADVDAFFATYSDPKLKGIGVMSKEPAKAGPGWSPSKYQILRRAQVTAYDPVYDRETKIITMVHESACPTCGHDTEGNKLTAGQRKFCRGKVYEGKDRPSRTCGEALYQYGKLNQQQVEKKQEMWDKRATITSKALYDSIVTGHKWPLSRYIKHRKFKIGMVIADELHMYKGKSTDQGRAFHNLVRQSKYTVGLTGTLFGGKASDLYFMLFRMFPRAFASYGYKFSAENAFVSKYGRVETTFRKAEAKSSGRTTGLARQVANVKEIPGISPGIYEYVLPFAIFAKIDDLGVRMPKFTETIHRLAMQPNQKEQYDTATKILLDHVRAGYSSFDSQGMHEAQSLMSSYMQTARSRPNSAFRREEQWWKPSKEGVRIPYWVHTGAMPRFDLETIEEPAPEKFWVYDEEEDDEELSELLQNEDEDDEEERPRKPQPKMERHVSEDVDAPLPPPGMEAMIYDPVILANQLLPKEAWLLDTVKAQMERDRRCIIYVEQTAKRNIQPRLQRILTDAGYTCEIIPQGDAKGREEWIRQHPCDVLITHPAKVATGLDLVAFQTIIFYEMTNSLFIFWQALRRVWRLGQTKPVEVHYVVYKNTVEEGLLALMGHKMKAAHLLYGDSVETAVSSAVDGQDLMAELAAQILSDQNITTDGITNLVGEMGGGLPEDEEEYEELTDYSEESEDATVPASEAIIDAGYSVGAASPAPEESTDIVPTMPNIQRFIDEYTPEPEPALEQGPGLRVGHTFSYYSRLWIMDNPTTVKGQPAPEAHLIIDKKKNRVWKSAEHFELDTGMELALDWTVPAPLVTFPPVPALAPEPQMSRNEPEPVQEQPAAPEPPKKPQRTMAELYAIYGKNGRGKAA